jgi:hypothetical protein
MNCIDRQVKPIGFAGLVTHIHWTEPSNFFLSYLLGSNILSNIAEHPNKTMHHKVQEILTILCYLFQRILFNNGNGKISSKSQFYSLPPLSDDIKNAVKSYNEIVLESFSGYIKYLGKSKEGIVY